MQFQFTHELVLSGRKFQTRRLMKPGDYVFSSSNTEPATILDVWSANRRMKYTVGQTLAVQPGRGAKGIARIRITGIRCEDVRSISDDDVKAEGFKSKWDFLMTWVSMHDKGVYQQMVDWNGYTDALFRFCAREPADRYQVWCLTFELVAPEAAE